MKTAKSVVIIFIIAALVLSLVSCIRRSEDVENIVPEPREETAEKAEEPEEQEEPAPVQTKDDEPEEPSGEAEQDTEETETKTDSADESDTDAEKIKKLTSRGLDPDKPMVALTFDDGPSPEYTEKILDLLAEHGAVGTFFEVGNIAKSYPDIIRKELEYGCELGSHTYSHANLKEISEEEAIAEIDRANEVFIDITGEPASLLRPPYGTIGDRDRFANAPVVTWSVDTEDWRSRDADAVYQAVVDAGNLDGQVVLMHSLYGSTYDGLKMILDYLDENGYQYVTVSELAYYKHGDILEDNGYYGYDYWMQY